MRVITVTTFTPCQLLLLLRFETRISPLVHECRRLVSEIQTAFPQLIVFACNKSFHQASLSLTSPPVSLPSLFLKGEHPAPSSPHAFLLTVQQSLPDGSHQVLYPYGYELWRDNFCHSTEFRGWGSPARCKASHVSAEVQQHLPAW